MNSGLWIIMFFLIYYLIVIIPQRLYVAVRTKRKKGNRIMTNELIRSYIGKLCMVSTGNFGSSVKGKISRAEDNWIEVQTKKGGQLLNIDFVTNIVLIPEK